MRTIGARAFKVFNSKAEPAIAVIVKTKNGRFIASAPSGSSVGKREVKQYKSDIDAEIAYFNTKASSSLRGFKFSEFNDFENVERLKLGGNTVIALEFALLKALAHQETKEIYQIINPKAKRFPRLLGKVVGGGAHARAGDIQEYLFSPDSGSFTKNAFINAEIHHLAAEKLAKDKHFLGGKDAEGGWLTELPVTEILTLCDDLRQSSEKKYGCNIDLGIDVAASEMYRKNKYFWSNFSPKKKAQQVTSSGQVEIISNLMREHNILYVEDPFEENDMRSFSQLSSIKARKEICADDLTCTNPELLQEVIKNRAATAVIIKPNQIGSLIKTREFVTLAKKFGLTTVVSHRSGESIDSVISHLALAWEADFFKCGIAGGERIAKINELIRLERSLNTY